MEAEIQGLLSFRLNLGAKLTLFLKPLLLELFLGYSQKRIGPNKLSFICLLQPMADAIKLFIKTFSHTAIRLGINGAYLRTMHSNVISISPLWIYSSGFSYA